MVYVLIFVGVIFGLAVLGMLQRIGDAMQRIADCALDAEQRAIERYAYEISERKADRQRADLLTQAQQQVAQSQVDAVKQQALSLADQQALRDEQREHMAVCAKRYEALLSGESVSSAPPVKH